VGGCGPDFAKVADALGGIDCAGANPVVTVRNPLQLTNWTLPVIEVTVVLLAVAALVHAVRQVRRRGDPAGLVLWCATVVQVLVLEPPLYFPDAVGLQDRLGLIFVHNVFTVQFLYDRLPLYIVAFYPALTYLVYLLVRRTGVLRENLLVGAACFAVAFHCLYEVFDGLGPQLRWWAWNPVAPTNSPWLGSVPLTSAVIFAAASPFGIALAFGVLVTRPLRRGPLSLWSLALRTVAVALAGILSMVVFALPYGLFGPDPQRFGTARALVLWAELGLLAVVATLAWWRALTLPEVTARPDPRGSSDRSGVVAATTFLAVLVVLWASALPDALGARDGRTADGAPVGDLPYVGLCTLIAAGLIVLAGTRAWTHERHTPRAASRA
jgi:hypothetical protein